MIGFLFKLHEIRSAYGNKALFIGKCYSGVIYQGERVKMFSANSNLDDDLYLVESVNIDPNNHVDTLLVDVNYQGEPYYAANIGVWLTGEYQDISRMVISDVFDITGRGIVITGIVRNQSISVGNTMYIVSTQGEIKSVEIIGIEKQGQLYNTASAGDSVGLLLKGINKNEISSGAILCNMLAPIRFNNTQNTQNQHKKVALVIGNCRYDDGGELKCCINDARAIGSKLRDLGFQIVHIEDGDKYQIDNAIQRFSELASDADVGFVFYSGHGMQYNGENYMIPIDAELHSPSDIDYKCNRMSYVLAKMEDVRCKLKILVLDACRVNPFEKRWYKGSYSQGLGTMGTPTGTIVAFATSPNCVAYDGILDNSPYTIGLLKVLEEPDIDIVTYFNRVSSYVYQLTNQEQNPWFSCSALTGDFYLTK